MRTNWAMPKSGWRSYQSVIHKTAPNPASPYLSTRHTGESLHQGAVTCDD